MSASTLHLLIAIGLWYGFNTGANVYSKKFLNAKHDPMFLSFISMVFGALILIVWKLMDKVTGRSTMKPIYIIRTIPVAIFHLANTLLTYISMTSSSVALTYTIKAAEPLFTATGNYLIKKQVESFPVYLSLIIVLIGVALTSITDATFNSLGLIAALASNVTSTLRSIFVKADMETHPVAKSPSQFFAQISLVAALLGLPLVLVRWLFVGAGSLTADEVPLNGSLFDVPLNAVLLAGLLNAAYNLSSYHVIAHVHVLTHAVALVMKRVVLIVASLLIFGQAVSPLLVVGVLLSNLGVILYVYFKSKSHAPVKQHGHNDALSGPAAGVSPTVWRSAMLVAVVTVLVFAAGEVKTATPGGLTSNPNGDTNVDYNTADLDAEKVRATMIRRELERNQCFKKIKVLSYRLFSDSVRAKQHVALVDVPLNGNLEDAVTWYAEQLFFYAYGQYLWNLDWDTNSKFDLLQGMSTGTTFFTGTAPFGDRARSATLHQLSLVQTYPDMRVTFLPQSIDYKSDAQMKEDAKVLAAHDDIHMFLRDSLSLGLARKHYPNVKSQYAPDFAWTLGLQERAHKPIVDVVFILDKKGSTMAAKSTLERAKKTLVDKKYTFEEWDVEDFDMKVLAPHLHITPPEHRDLWPGYRMQILNKMISRGKVLITDRVHASTFASLIRIPIVYVDSNKVIERTRSDLHDFYSVCTDFALDTHPAENVLKAVAQAVKLLNRVESEAAWIE